MKTIFRNKFMTLVITLTMIFASFSAPVSAHAADITADEEFQLIDVTDLVATPASTNAHISYYPSSGANSGVFSGNISNTATYNNLPSGNMKISYCLSGTGTAKLRFTHGSSYNEVNLIPDDYAHITQIYLPYSGQYKVQVVLPNNATAPEVIYAFTLFRD